MYRYQWNHIAKKSQARKWQACCPQQIKWRLFPAASSSPPPPSQSQFLWHRAFRQSLSVCFVLSLIYSFKQWQPHSKTMLHKLRVELTSIIMQIWGKKSPIVTHSSKFLPPPVFIIQVNTLRDSRKYSSVPPQDPLKTTVHYIISVRITLQGQPILFVCITEYFHIALSLMEACIHWECIIR